MEGAKIEIRIVSIVHKLKKIWKHRGEMKGILKENGNLIEENLDFVVFVEIYYFEILIVGRPPLFNSPEYLQGLIFSATMPKAKNQSREPY